MAVYFREGRRNIINYLRRNTMTSLTLSALLLYSDSDARCVVATNCHDYHCDITMTARVILCWHCSSKRAVVIPGFNL